MKIKVTVNFVDEGVSKTSVGIALASTAYAIAKNEDISLEAALRNNVASMASGLAGDLSRNLVDDLQRTGLGFKKIKPDGQELIVSYQDIINLKYPPKVFPDLYDREQSYLKNHSTIAVSKKMCADVIVRDSVETLDDLERVVLPIVRGYETMSGKEGVVDSFLGHIEHLKKSDNSKNTENFKHETLNAYRILIGLRDFGLNIKMLNDYS